MMTFGLSRGYRFGWAATLVWVASLLWFGMAHAQTQPTQQQRKAATEAFKSCRDQEKLGDATTCWKLWLERHRAAGSEAEVMVAEERVAGADLGLGQRESKPTPETEPPPAPSPDTPQPPPSGETGAAVEKKPEEKKPDKPPPTPAAAGGSAFEVAGADLCGMKVDAGKKGFVKKRVVVFAVANTEAIERDASLKKVSGGRVFNEVFLKRFPVTRFANVTSTLAGKAGWEKQPTLSVQDIQNHVKASGSANPDAADFLSKVVGCADYVAFPTITVAGTEPAEASGANAPSISLTVDAQMGIFRKTESGFQLMATLEASAPTLFGRAEEMAARKAAETAPGMDQLDQLNAAANKAQDSAQALGDAASQAGDTAGAIAKGEVPGATKLGAGTGSGKKTERGPLIKDPFADLHEAFTTVCRKPKGPDDGLVCMLRIRAYQLALSLKNEAMSGVDGWQLSAPLKFGAGGAPIFSLGDKEDLSVGGGFVAVGPNGERLGYFKVVSVGPGGSEGEEKPSELDLRLGEASEGTMLQEYRMLGLSVGLYGTFSALIMNTTNHLVDVEGDPANPSCLDTVSTCVVEFGVPNWSIGGGLALRYDLSWLISWPESHVRVDGEFQMGTGSSTSLTAIPISLSFEKGFTLGKAFGLFVGLGGGVTLLSMELTPPELGTAATGVPLPPRVTSSGGPAATTTEPQTLSAMQIGALGLLGFEWLFSPHFALRLDGAARIHFGGASYETDDPRGVGWGFDNRSDSFSSVGGRLGAFAFF